MHAWNRFEPIVHNEVLNNDDDWERYTLYTNVIERQNLQQIYWNLVFLFVHSFGGGVVIAWGPSHSVDDRNDWKKSEMRRAMEEIRYEIEKLGRLSHIPHPYNDKTQTQWNKTQNWIGI